MPQRAAGGPPGQVIEINRRAPRHSVLEATMLRELHRSLRKLNLKDRLRLLNFFAEMASYIAAAKGAPRR